MFDQDDENTDRLDYLADRHADLFEWMNEEIQKADPITDWELFLTEPSDEEMEKINRAAQDLLNDLENLW